MKGKHNKLNKIILKYKDPLIYNWGISNEKSAQDK